MTLLRHSHATFLKAVTSAAALRPFSRRLWSKQRFTSAAYNFVELGIGICIASILNFSLRRERGRKKKHKKRKKKRLCADSASRCDGTAQTRQQGNYLGQRRDPPLPLSPPLEVEEGKKNNCESQNKVCLSISTSGSLGFSFLSRLSRQASPGVRGKTGEHQGRQETRLEPLKEVPHRGETSDQSGLV